MTKQHEFYFTALVERYIDGSLSESEFAELESLLLRSAESRRLYLDLTHQHAHLRMLGDSLVQDELHVASFQRWRAFARGSVAAAACLLLCFLIWRQFSQPHIVATLVSSEYAAWESSSPTTPGTPLPPGFLKLDSGVATIRFLSGAEIVMQAPCHLILETDMRAKLLSGSAVIRVPDSAIGFVVDTPQGFAVDHGTEFAVSVDEAKQESTFEVLDGEISVNHERATQSMRLTENQLAVATPDTLAPHELSHDLIFASELDVLRFGTSRETSIIRNNSREKYLHSDFLMAKSCVPEMKGFDRLSLLQFDISTVDVQRIQSAQIRLNLVPTGLGHAAYLPETNTFAVYGLPDGEAEQWAAEGLRWEDAPAIEQGQRLGTFDVPRGKQTGSFTLSNEALVEFLHADTDRLVSFALLRLSAESRFRGLVHAFASSQHPQASGPTLEVTLQ